MVIKQTKELWQYLKYFIGSKIEVAAVSRSRV